MAFKKIDMFKQAVGGMVGTSSEVPPEPVVESVQDAVVPQAVPVMIGNQTATHTLFEGKPLVAWKDQKYDRDAILQSFVDYVFHSLNVTSLNISFFGHTLMQYVPNGYEITQMADQKFLSVLYVPANLAQISSLIDGIKEAKDRECFVTSLVREVEVGAYTLAYSPRDLETVRSHFPEYTFGLIDDNGEVSDLRLVVGMT